MGDGTKRDKFMRIFVFFDLPTNTKKERKEASKFRKFLIDDGYDMLQYSVYVRICKGADAIDKHRRHIQTKLPQKGSIRFLPLTNATYERMENILGDCTQNEKMKGSKQLLLF